MATGDLIQAQVMDSSTLPNGGTINGNGCILRLRFEGLAGNIGGTYDVTKISGVGYHPGYSTAKVFSSTNVTRALAVTGLQRRPYPNDALRIEAVAGADLDVYFTLASYWYVSDTLSSITVAAGAYQGCNAGTLSTSLTMSSTRAYECPQIGFLALAAWDTYMTSSGLYVEAIVDHWNARADQPVAAVDFYVTDGTNTSTASSNSMTLSTQITAPYQPGCYAATVPIGSLAQGRGNLGATIYPWVGSTTWDTNSALFDDFPANGTAKLHPVCIDTDGSYAWAGAYISHTGVQIGTPTIGLVSALAAYVPGTTPAYANLSALLLAGKTYNSSGSRTRTHADVAAIKAVIPSGYKMGTYTANLTSTTTYPPGLRACALGIEAGASKTTTGITTNANSHPTRFLIDGCGVFPGAAGSATHTVTNGGNNGGSGASTKLSEAAAVYLDARDCTGTGNDDNTFAVFTATGWSRFTRCNFTAFGKQWLTPSQTYFIALVQLHGCTVDNRTNTTPTTTSAAMIAGCQLYDIAIATSAVGAGVGDPLGKMVHSNRVDCNETTSTRAFTHYVGHDRAIGVRGESWVNVLATKTLVGGTAGTTDGDASSLAISPVIQVSADYVSPNYTDEPAIQNVNLAYCSFVGSRSNIAYNEQYVASTATRIVKELRVIGVVVERKNNKMDNWAVTAGASSGVRTGAMAYRFGTAVTAMVDAQGSSNGTTLGTASWLGEVTPPNSASNVGLANMFTTDVSLTGTNAGGTGNYSPKTALQSLVPAGRAATKYDLFGAARNNASAGAAGAIEQTGSSNLSGSISLAFAAAAVLAGAGLLSGTSALALAASGTLAGSGALTGASGLTIASTGALTGNGALAGASAVTFASSGALVGVGALAGASAVTLASTGTLSGFGALSASAGLTFGASGAVIGVGSLSGLSALTFGATGTLTSANSLSGTASMSFTSTGALAGKGALSGSAGPMQFGASGVLSGTGSLTGTTGVTFSVSGTMGGAAGITPSRTLLLGTRSGLTLSPITL